MPPAVIVNRTVAVSIQTSLPTLNLGSAVYYVTAFFSGLNQTLAVNFSMPAPAGTFLVNSFVASRLETIVYYISVNHKGNSMLAAASSQFSVLQNLFLVPSSGQSIGGELRILESYDDIPRNISFVQESRAEFACSKSGSQLNCTAPSITPYPHLYPFHHHYLSIGNQTLSLPYVVFESMNIISVVPRVISKLVSPSSFKCDILLSSNVKLISGSVTAALAPFTINSQYVELTNNGTLFAPQFATPNEGYYNIEMWYKNDQNILEVFRSVAFAKYAKTIVVVQPKTLSLVENDIVHQFTTGIVTVTMNSLIENSLLSNVSCLMNGTTYLADVILNGTKHDIRCQINSTTAGAHLLFVQYSNANDAQNGSVILSSNSISVIVLRPIKITSLVPFASDQITPNVTINSENVVEYGLVSYYCSYLGLYFPATVHNNIYYCIINRFQIVHGNVQLSVHISTATTRKLLSNAEVFSFLAISAVVTVFPSSFRTVAQPMFVNVTIDIVRPVLTIVGLFCQCISQGVTFNATATQVSSNSVVCSISTAVQSPLQAAYVRLMMHNGVGAIALSNQTSLLFISQFAGFTDDWISDITVQSSIITNFIVPSPFAFTISLIVVGNLQCINNGISNTSCMQPIIVSDIVPLELNPFIQFTNEFNTLSTYSLKRLTYSVRTSILAAFPYMVTPYDITPITLITDVALNATYNLTCMVTSLQAPVYTTRARVSSLGIICNILGRYVEEQYTVGILWNAFDQTPFNKALVSTINRTDFVEEYGPIAGGTQLSLKLPQLPTIFNSSYSYKIILKDRLQLANAVNCSISESFILSCYTPAYNVSRTRVELYINNSKSLSIGSFQYYLQPLVTNILPSVIFDMQSYKSILLSGLFPFVPKFSPKVLYYSFGYTSYQDCAYISSASIRCGAPASPFFNSTRLYVLLSFNNGQQYTNTSTFLFVQYSTKASVFAVIPREFEPGRSNSTCIYGALNDVSSAALVHESLGAIYPTILNSSTTYMCFSIPILYDEPVTFPISLSILLRTTDGSSIHTVHNITFRAFNPVHVSRFSIVGSSAPIFVPNIPILELKPQHSEMKVHLSLKPNPSISYLLACNISLCSFTQVIPPGIYSLRFVVVGSSNITLPILVTGAIEILAQPVLSKFAPTNLMLGVTKSLLIHGSNFPSSTNDLALRISIITPSKRASFQVDVDILQITPTYLVVSLAKLSAIGWIQNITLRIGDQLAAPIISSQLPGLLQLSSITKIENPEDDFQPSLFIFKDTIINVIGSNLQANLTLMKLKIYSSISNYVNLAIENPIVNFVSQSNIRISFSSEIFQSLSSALRFPYSDARLGISYNEGFDYVSIPILLLNKYSAPSIVTVDQTIIPRNEQIVILVRGQYFANVTKCIYFFKNTNISVNVIASAESNVLYCRVSANMFSSDVMQVQLNVQNTRLELSSRDISLFIYDVPSVALKFPKTGPSFGNYEVVLQPNVIDKRFTVYSRLSQVEQTTPCNFIDTNTTTVLRCFMGSNEVGRTLIGISYNRRHWYDAQTSFDVVSCKAGWYSIDYKLQCAPCPIGTYKPTAGIYECISCPNDTFASSIGSIKCSSCPLFSISGSGSKLVAQCVCTPGYYSAFATNQFCFKCPIGSNCSTVNTTRPFAARGYWFENITSISSCSPIEACPGGISDTCSPGYKGVRCGQCDKNFYKHRLGSCSQCSNQATANLFIALGLVIAVFTFFLLFGSVKISHISSLSIASSFFQVLFMFTRINRVEWPSYVDGAFSFASVLSFNFDFLSPECLFPTLTFEQKYIGTLLLQVCVLIGFVLFYVAFEIRSMFAKCIGAKICCIKYFTYVETGLLQKTLLKRLAFKIYKGTANIILFMLNWVIWFFKDPSTRSMMSILRDNIMSAYFSYVFFSFSYFTLHAMEVFHCTKQQNGDFTMNLSSDIICFSDYRWFIVLPFASAFLLEKVGYASILYIYLSCNLDKLDDASFRRKFKFSLGRFKRKYFYWTGLVLTRKILMSICIAFLAPMTLIICTLGIISASLLLHIQCVPYRKKFHNLLEYVMLIATLISLFCGLLFLVDKFPSEGFKLAMQILCITIVVLSCILVVSMTVYDYFVRKKKHTQRNKRRKRHQSESSKTRAAQEFVPPLVC